MARLKHAKAKGNKHEREVAKLLGIVLYDDKDCLKRAPTSGASLWKGDIVPDKEGRGGFFAGTKPAREKHPAGEFPLIIECKHDKQVHIEPFLTGDKGFINAVWKKTCKEANASNAMPILVVKNNHTSPFFITTIKCSEYLNIPSFDSCSGNGSSYFAYVMKNNEEIIILPLKFITNTYKGVLL